MILASSAGPRELEVLRTALDADDAIDAVTSAGDVDAEQSRRPTWCRSRFRRPAPARRARCSWATPSGSQSLRAAGVSCVGVLSGGTSEAELRSAGAVRVYPGPAELLEAFPASLFG